MTYKKRGSLVCSADEKDKLVKISKSKTAQKRHVQRSVISLMYMEGNSIAVISRAVGLSRESVYACIDKALAFGPVAALNDLAGRGAPAEITDEDKTWLLSVACQQPKELGYSYEIWTVNLLAKHIQKVCLEKGHPSLRRAGKSLVHGILDKAGIKPHKISYYLERRDPLFEEKMAQVLAVYKEVELINSQELSNEDHDNETRKRTTISYDEKPGIQAIKNIAAQLSPVPGKYTAVGRDYEYKRLGTLSLLAGIDLHTGEIIPLVEERHRSAEFVSFLKKVSESYPDDWTIKIILDNHASHQSKETMKYLATVPGKFVFVFTPTHGSWLNMIEMFFSKITRTFLRHIRVQNKQELKERIYQGISEINKEPVVFKWKYKMEDENVKMST
ncbi:MAG: IS630 family transposase [Aquaticitalea sp.]